MRLFILLFYLSLTTPVLAKHCFNYLSLGKNIGPDDDTVRSFIGKYSRSDEIKKQLPERNNDLAFTEDFTKEEVTHLRANASSTIRKGSGYEDFLKASQYVQAAVKEKRLPTKADFIHLSELLGKKGLREVDVYNGSHVDFKYVSHLELDAALDNLTHFIHNDNSLHPIEKAAIAYQYFVSIHPYSDANGRAGRLLLDWILMYYGYPYCIFLPFESAAGVFSGRLGNSVKTERVVQNVINGINNSIALKAKTDN